MQLNILSFYGSTFPLSVGLISYILMINLSFNCQCQLTKHLEFFWINLPFNYQFKIYLGSTLPLIIISTSWDVTDQLCFWLSAELLHIFSINFPFNCQLNFLRSCGWTLPLTHSYISWVRKSNKYYFLWLFFPQVQAGWLQHDLGHLSVSKSRKVNRALHAMTMGCLKVRSSTVPEFRIHLKGVWN